jgi:hypothetical protein
MTKITQEFAYGSTHILKAEIVPKKSITVFYEHKDGKIVSDVEFGIGDTAIYDSFNLKYLGKIVSITEKTVTITPRWG